MSQKTLETKCEFSFHIGFKLILMIDYQSQFVALGDTMGNNLLFDLN